MDKELIITRLRYFYRSNKRMPTYGEMCKLLGYKSKGAVQYVVKKLIEDGVIEKDEQGALVPKSLLDIPLLGIIKAGFPMVADVQQDSYLRLHLLFDDLPPDTFALQVSGDSMIDKGIYEGDYVLVDNSREVKNGDIVAACVDNEWTVKTIQKDDGGFVLIPANKKYPVIRPTESLTIGGVVAHVIRNYR